MSNLHEIQYSFYQAILNKNHAVDFIKSNNASKRFEIYRSTIIENLRNSLSLTFPGICILLGNECFNSVAYVFSKNPDNLPSTGCLDDWGEDFPNFLAQQSELQDLPYLKDYAVYEWLLHLAYNTAEVKAIDPRELTDITDDRIEDICFTFIPSLFLYNANFPIGRIQTIIEDPNLSAITLNKEPTGVVLAKINQQVVSLFVPQDHLLFFQFLYDGKTLGQAVTEITTRYPDFNLTLAMHFLLEYALIKEVKNK